MEPDLSRFEQPQYSVGVVMVSAAQIGYVSVAQDNKPSLRTPKT
jgi:hypothetical protein